jgi:hypothetical protein
MHTSTTKEIPMTDQSTLERLLSDAEAELRAATRWAATADHHAPLAIKVKDQARIERARIELDALRDLEPEA